MTQEFILPLNRECKTFDLPQYPGQFLKSIIIECSVYDRFKYDLMCSLVVDNQVVLIDRAKPTEDGNKFVFDFTKYFTGKSDKSKFSQNDQQLMDDTQHNLEDVFNHIAGYPVFMHSKSPCRVVYWFVDKTPQAVFLRATPIFSQGPDIEVDTSKHGYYLPLTGNELTHTNLVKINQDTASLGCLRFDDMNLEKQNKHPLNAPTSYFQTLYESKYNK